MNAEAWLMVALLVILFSLLIWGKLPTWLVFFGCILFTNIITNAAAASIMFPVALLLSTTLGVSFTPFAVVLMLGTSYAFINPAGYQTNLMVQEPGNYTFLDFAKLGLPLTILVGISVLLLTLLIYKFSFHRANTFKISKPVWKRRSLLQDQRHNSSTGLYSIGISYQPSS
jgi:di/tricarboxylate transporter